VKVLPTLALLCAALLGAPAGAAPALIDDTMTARLAACSTCHGAQGRAAPDGYHPRIAGKPAGYLLNQLLNFRDGRRHYGPMVAMVTPLPEAYLREIAEYYASRKLPYALPPLAQADASALARGKQLALAGDAARGIAACSACHGEQLTGRLPATPGLLGLPRDYLVGQLGAWVNGQRRAHAPDCMADIAQRLAGADLAAVAAWLASQAVPEGAPVAAAPAADEKLPMKCGSAVAP
jgi:cytochrome c553